jgi:DNA-binding phage protein
MNQRAVFFWIAGGLVCAALAVFLFIANTEWETVQTKGGMSLEALRNPYLATERFLARMARKTQQIKNPIVLDSLPEGGVLILAGGREGVVDKARAQKILDWVARGGYLILERDGSVEKDPLLLPFGVTDGDGRTKKQGIVRYERAMDDSSYRTSFVEARLPDDDQHYRISSSSWGMKPGEEPPLWQVENDHASMILHYAWGSGNVTAVGDLDFFSNRELGDFDHAEFFWALLQHYQPEGVIHFATRMKYPTLWQWLLTTAWRVLPSMAVLILIWLFWIVPRFGGVCAAPEAERRGLSEHLLALGRCLWREDAVDALLDTARREIAYRLAQRHPRLLRLSVAERSQELARKSGLAATEIDAALDSNATPSPETFTRAMQTVQNLERVL